MSTHEQDQPIMDGAGEATADEKRAGLAEQVAYDHRDSGSEAMAADLDRRTEDAGLGEGPADPAATQATSTGSDGIEGEADAEVDGPHPA
ncbi:MULTISPECIES: hypothetical protein [Clavibacter]|jgi:hypothetical protein|uniref:Uncharacterized protein n=4 Tax=Clavibacter TaxID=1573 RepID=A0AAI8ZHR7_9MICO|nr:MULTISPECIES: hypothetical protein [Clavibacter]AJW78593.1 hypothetical protein VO01_05130 [Clavibacter michiganensis subsp. insidiosus]AWF98758.1 hypothetical protein BEH61_09595 [Clavibacter michiganensis subsp. insidiosus]AWG01023.1 hypothetical protein BEH62_05375 [Clavibacter michiganensis subsp. insidiosus]KXU20925.1 hypothetical protein VV38_05620 [Clavibacter nebraskensis]OAH22362.1 hypothetical protein A3Q38_02945 [Clavibacter nebraskensis]